MDRILTIPFFKDRHRGWGLEPTIFLLIGLALLPYPEALHHLDVVSETIILVTFLAGLMGVTRSIGIPLSIPIHLVPFVCGFGSMFMDSFLILLILTKAKIGGNEQDKLKFLVINTAAALIGGTGTYFGEVYLLPLCLKYGMREWWSTLPLLPPIILFLVCLSRISKKLDIKLEVGTVGGKLSIQDCLEFIFFIALLLWSKNSIVCLFALLIWSYISGQGHEFIEGVWEIDKAVLGLLGFALLLLHAPPFFLTDLVKEGIASSTGWYAFIPSSINGVLTGALYPATGDFWKEALILSTGVLVTPASALVGLMVFKPRMWAGYFRYMPPIMILWFLICGIWLFGPWKMWLEEPFYELFGKRPTLSLSVTTTPVDH
ncbi:MAG: hypothetical protein Q8P86_02305 [bacterium]|nr:hypothetical protein [bacterium]